MRFPERGHADTAKPVTFHRRLMEDEPVRGKLPDLNRCFYNAR